MSCARHPPLAAQSGARRRGTSVTAERDDETAGSGEEVAGAMGVRTGWWLSRTAWGAVWEPPLRLRMSLLAGALRCIRDLVGTSSTTSTNEHTTKDLHT